MASLQRISVSLIIVLSCLNASGGDPWKPPAGAREAGMSYVCLTGNSFWSSFHNQALLAGSSLSAGFSYENRFGIKELGTRYAALRVPAGNASIGGVYSYFGYPDFRRQSAGIACGLQLSRKISAGAQVDYFSEKTTGEYSDHQAITFETGLLFSVNENVSLGVHVFNPLPDRLHDIKLPTIIRAGAGISLSPSLFAGFEAEMNDVSYRKALVVRAGFDFEAIRHLFLRGGFSSENSSFSMGLGYDLGFVQLDLAFATHDRLGITSTASFIFEIDKKKNLTQRAQR
ncbi:MAG TPA: hypothetical protein VK155_12585 [Bacteroidales bacterium]|nr:hypothetical protein [Bacteroidales bacterium]